MEAFASGTDTGASYNAQPSDKTHVRRFRGFGCFLVEAGDYLTMKTLKKLTTVMELKPAFWDELKEAELPGIYFLDELVSRGDISESDISILTHALEDQSINYHGISKDIANAFHNNCCDDIENSQKVFTDTSEANPKSEFSNNSINETTNTHAPRDAACTLTPISKILNMESEHTVRSVKGIIVKIALHRVNFREQGTIMTLKDARYPFLTVIVDEEELSTLDLCEGDIIELMNFITKRSKRRESMPCYLLSRRESSLKKLNDTQLQQVLNQLPIFGRYQVRGICTYIESVPYHACSQPQCLEKKLVPRGNNVNDKYLLCRRCGTEYSLGDSTIGNGCYYKLTISDDGDEVSNSTVQIIFNQVVTKILKEMDVVFQMQNQREIQNKFKDLVNDKKVRAIVAPGTPYKILKDLMVIRKQKRNSDEATAVHGETIDV